MILQVSHQQRLSGNDCEAPLEDPLFTEARGAFFMEKIVRYTCHIFK